MRKSRFADEQIVEFIRQGDAGLSVAEFCRKHGFANVSHYKWRTKFGDMDIPDTYRLRELEAENK